MVHIRGHYGSRHPKDKAARKARELQKRIRGRMCTKSEMWNPSDYNINKHIKEQKLTGSDARDLKEIVKALDPEDKRWGNTENFRPKR